MTSSKTPSHPMLKMLLSLASKKGWPIETWDVSTAFLYARLYGDRDTDLDGQCIYMRPPRVIEKLGLLAKGTIWKLKKALYGLRTSPLAWEVERDNSLAELQWEIDGSWYGLTPAKGNPCLWAVVRHQDKTRRLSCSWHLCFHDGENSQGGRRPFGEFVEICLVVSLLCDVHTFSRKGLVCGLLSDLQEASHGSKIAPRIRQDGQSTDKEQGSPEIPCFHIHSFTDASFATSQGRSRSGYMICLVHPKTGNYSVLQWSSRRQTITAYSAPQAEIVAMSEGVMTALLT